MRIQADQQTRVVALSNLEAMCERVSGCMCHQFTVEKVTRSRVHVSYSNEDEWAVEHPMVAVFPCYPAPFGNECYVVLDILRVLYDNWDGEGWQAFQVLLDCPKLWRNPVDNDWYPHDNTPAERKL